MLVLLGDRESVTHWSTARLSSRGPSLNSRKERERRKSLAKEVSMIGKLCQEKYVFSKSHKLLSTFASKVSL